MYVFLNVIYLYVLIHVNFCVKLLFCKIYRVILRNSTAIIWLLDKNYVATTHLSKIYLWTEDEMSSSCGFCCIIYICTLTHRKKVFF